MWKHIPLAPFHHLLQVMAQLFCLWFSVSLSRNSSRTHVLNKYNSGDVTETRPCLSVSRSHVFSGGYLLIP